MPRTQNKTHTPEKPIINLSSIQKTTHTFCETEKCRVKNISVVCVVFQQKL